MTKLNKIIILAITAIALAALAVLAFLPKPAAEQLSVDRRTADAFPVVPMTPEFYDQANFYNAMAAAKDVTPERGVRAVVVPHHLLASRLVADALARAKGNEYSRIVIVGPNHDDRGPDVLSSVAVEYKTPAGTVLPDEEVVNYFRQEFVCRSGAEVFIGEHSIGAIVPFVAQTFPQAGIVPVIVSSKARSAEAERLAKWLAQLPVDTLVVFSVDFSHYLTRDVADAMDKETAIALAAKDVGMIESWGNEHIDASFIISTMLRFAEKTGTDLEIVAVKNANDYLSRPDVSTTSYFEIIVK